MCGIFFFFFFSFFLFSPPPPPFSPPLSFPINVMLAWNLYDSVWEVLLGDGVGDGRYIKLFAKEGRDGLFKMKSKKAGVGWQQSFSHGVCAGHAIAGQHKLLRVPVAGGSVGGTRQWSCLHHAVGFRCECTVPDVLLQWKIFWGLEDVLGFRKSLHGQLYYKMWMFIQYLNKSHFTAIKNFGVIFLFFTWTVILQNVNVHPVLKQITFYYNKEFLGFFFIFSLWQLFYEM